VTGVQTCALPIFCNRLGTIIFKICRNQGVSPFFLLQMNSGISGKWLREVFAAFDKLLANAAGIPIIPCSPTPLAPYGPSNCSVFTKYTIYSGCSSNRNVLYVRYCLFILLLFLLI